METSSPGAFIALNTTKSRTRAALGTDAEDTDAAVDVNLMIKKKSECEKCTVYSLNQFAATDWKWFLFLSKKTGCAKFYDYCKNDVAYMTVRISPNPRYIPFIWAMKIAAIATKSAVPSILMLQPIGRTNLRTRASMRNLLAINRYVTGNAAALKALVNTLNLRENIKILNEFFYN